MKKALMLGNTEQDGSFLTDFLLQKLIKLSKLNIDIITENKKKRITDYNHVSFSNFKLKRDTGSKINYSIDDSLKETLQFWIEKQDNIIQEDKI